MKNIENKNIKQSRLFDFLSAKGYSEHLCNAAIDKLSRTVANMQHGVYDANKEVYSMLKYGISVSDGTSSAPKTVYFIDFDCPANNDFAIAEEVTIKETQEKCHDLVIYLNGIAVAVIEMKSSIVLVSK